MAVEIPVSSRGGTLLCLGTVKNPVSSAPLCTFTIDDAIYSAELNSVRHFTIVQIEKYDPDWVTKRTSKFTRVGYIKPYYINDHDGAVGISIAILNLDEPDKMYPLFINYREVKFDKETCTISIYKENISKEEFDKKTEIFENKRSPLLIG